VAVEAVGWRKRHYPFNAEQTVNILGEIGPLVAMFLVNGMYGIAAGTWALIACTLLSLVATLVMLGRPPIMPFIAGAVSVTFGALTLITGNAMWVQIKVTLFNALVALMLWVGMRTGHNFFRFVFGKTFHYTEEGWTKLTRNVAMFFLLTAELADRLQVGPLEEAALDDVCVEGRLQVLEGQRVVEDADVALAELGGFAAAT